MPELRQWCIQANANVARLEPSEENYFDYWLAIATLERGQPIKLPVKLADYHKEALKDEKTGKRKKINSSVALNKRDGIWWLTLTFDEEVGMQIAHDAPIV